MMQNLQCQAFSRLLSFPSAFLVLRREVILSGLSSHCLAIPTTHTVSLHPKLTVTLDSGPAYILIGPTMNSLRQIIPKYDHTRNQLERTCFPLSLSRSSQRLPTAHCTGLKANWPLLAPIVSAR